MRALAPPRASGSRNNTPAQREHSPARLDVKELIAAISFRRLTGERVVIADARDDSASEFRKRRSESAREGCPSEIDLALGGCRQSKGSIRMRMESLRLSITPKKRQRVLFRVLHRRPFQLRDNNPNTKAHSRVYKVHYTVAGLPSHARGESDKRDWTTLPL